MDSGSFEDYSKRIKDMFSLPENDFDIDEALKEYDINIKSLENEMKNYSPTLSLPYKKLNSDAVTPVYNYPTDSGFDLHSTEEIFIPPFGRALIPTGLAFDIKDGYEIQVRPKSGLSLKQGLLCILGTVDNGYTGEVKVILYNMNNFEFKVEKGMKVAQGVLSPVVNGKWVSLEPVTNLNEKDRKNNGFGSTGIGI